MSSVILPFISINILNHLTVLKYATVADRGVLSLCAAFKVLKNYFNKILDVITQSLIVMARANAACFSSALPPLQCAK